ncbi:MAG: endonuclease III [Waddliaceae bacterium]
MKAEEKAVIIQEILNQTFPSPPIPLHHHDPYTLLIAVMLSAQCTDARVNRITPLLFAKAKTPFQMCQLRVEEIEEIIRPCGLAPRKSRAIWESSQIIEKKYHGKVPNTFEALENLPGVGHKTASVVMAQAFGEPAFPVDTHIHRCAKRWGLSEGKTVEKTERDLKHLFSRSDWIKIHLQIIYFARKYCPARNHNARLCPICSKVVEEFPLL